MASPRVPARAARATVPAAIAARGMTVTVSAAATGVRCQPSISRRTSRNSAAVSAAESRPSATLAAILGGRRARAGTVQGGLGLARPSRIDGPPGGIADRRDRQEHERHLHEEDRAPGERLGEQPPGDRPDARADHPAVAHRAAPSRALPLAATSSSREAVITSAPPIAWIAPRRDQGGEVRGDAAERGGRREHRDADERAAACARRREAAAGGGHGSEAEHEVVGGEHPGHVAHLRVVLAQHVGSASVTIAESARTIPTARESTQTTRAILVVALRDVRRSARRFLPVSKRVRDTLGARESPPRHASRCSDAPPSNATACPSPR